MSEPWTVQYRLSSCLMNIYVHYVHILTFIIIYPNIVPFFRNKIVIHSYVDTYRAGKEKEVLVRCKIFN